jgi:hypothetical protein
MLCNYRDAHTLENTWVIEISERKSSGPVPGSGSAFNYDRFDDDDDVYLNKLQTKGVKKSILYTCKT